MATKKATKKVKPALDSVDAVLAALKAKATKKTLQGMARYAIPSDHAWGVAVGDIRDLGKRIGRNHQLAAALWKTGVYEARMLTAFVEDPEHLTRAQMDRWARDFDNWAICDTLCFHLFDRTPHAFAMVEKWAKDDREFIKRAAFALLASLAGHDRTSPDSAFARCLPLVERAAADERNFVKKGVSWALRGIGRRSAGLKKASVEVAKRLAASEGAAERFIGKGALRELGARPAR